MLNKKITKIKKKKKIIKKKKKKNEAVFEG